MNPNCILIRYGEIALKGKITRRQFEKQLRNNIKKVLQKNSIHFSFSIVQGRILIYTKKIDTSIDVLSHVFGITSLSPAYAISTDLTPICEQVLSLIDNYHPKGLNFALRVTRVGNHSFTSQDIAIKVGSYVQENKKIAVNLTNPDIEVFIEIRDDQTFVFLEKIKGPGGMPMGSQGQVITIIESVNDLLASWYLLKRGCTILFLYSDEKIINKSEKFFLQWHIPKNMVYINKDMDLWNQLKKTINEYNCKAYCSGLTLSKNKNKTIDQMRKLKKQISIPILTPLISFDDEKIQNLCEKKGISQ